MGERGKSQPLGVDNRIHLKDMKSEPERGEGGRGKERGKKERFKRPSGYAINSLLKFPPLTSSSFQKKAGRERKGKKKKKMFLN